MREYHILSGDDVMKYRSKEKRNKIYNRRIKIISAFVLITVFIYSWIGG